MTASRPAAVAFHLGSTERINILTSLAEKGMTTLYMDDKEYWNVLKQVPDTLGKSQEEIDAMPPYVRSFKCDGKVEEGDPYCGEEKYNNNICSDRRYKASWHPGWKEQAVKGNLMALFLVELLHDALQDIQQAELENKDTLTLQVELIEQETADYQRVIDDSDSELPQYSKSYHPDEPFGEELRQLYYKEPNFCHIALLPSEIRYKGILTETEPVDMFNLPDGPNATQNGDTPYEGDQMRLVGDESTRQTPNDVFNTISCPVPLNQDHPDFFLVSNRETQWREPL